MKYLIDKRQENRNTWIEPSGGIDSHILFDLCLTFFHASGLFITSYVSIRTTEAVRKLMTSDIVTLLGEKRRVLIIFECKMHRFYD
jgi:hypothetical protein